MRAAIYARVSTAEQSVDMQLAELRQLAAARSWTVVDEWIDHGVSGARDTRPALGRLLAAARAKQLDVVMVWRLDRLGRSVGHLITTLDELRRLDVAFVSARDAGLDTTTPTGRLMLVMLAAFAQFERELIRERAIAGIRQAQAAGTHCGRPGKALDVAAARVLLAAGRTHSEVAAALQVSQATLRRRLAANG